MVSLTKLIGLVATLTLALSGVACKARNTTARVASDGKCEAEANLVTKLELERKNAGQATAGNSDAKVACTQLSGSNWNETIGRCECKTDPTKFSGNAWSIKNTLKCEANTGGFDACRLVSGAKWNVEIGRCECVTDPTKFQGNAFSIKNNLKCEANISGADACKAVPNARWNTELGRCECTNDATKFQANSWSIRNTLKCGNGTGNGGCPFGGAFNPSLGECACADGSAYSSYSKEPCKSATGGMALTGESGEFMALARTIEDIKTDLEKARAALDTCRSSGTTGGVGASANTGGNTSGVRGCDAAGGKLDAENTCRCENGTPVFKLRNESCTQHLAKQNEGCTSAGGVIHDVECVCSDGTPVRKKNPARCDAANTSSGGTNTGAGVDTGATGGETGSTGVAGEVDSAPPVTTTPTSCKCGWDTNYRLCVVWKDGKALYPYIGPTSRQEWNCGDSSANDLCQRGTLSGVLGGAQCI